MNIQIPDEIVEKLLFTEKEYQEILAVSLYQMKKINGVQGGRITGVSEIEFHEIVGKWGQLFSYDENDLLDDIKTIKNFKN
ncbi:hypothetical protein MAH1_15280 [Sessilibacter sp. MAH1]